MDIQGKENHFIVVDLWEDVIYSSDSRDEAFIYATNWVRTDPSSGLSDIRVYELVGEIK